MITLDGVSKTYGGRRAVGPLSIDIPDGQFVALLGGSGCGKTTTLKMINGLVTPDDGRVRVEGRAVGSEPLWALRRRIGYVFQDVGLFPHMTIGENLAIGPRLAGWAAARTTERARALLSLVALPEEVGGRLPAALSGGQRQRVGVARALAVEPKVMLMDEPFGALDPITRDALGQDYRGLHVSLGLTTVMVTHDVMEALFLADRIVVMDAGRVVADGTPEDLAGEQADPVVAALMAAPRRQAERFEALNARAAHG